MIDYKKIYFQLIPLRPALRRFAANTDFYIFYSSLIPSVAFISSLWDGKKNVASIRMKRQR
jgi:hypothetical protein